MAITTELVGKIGGAEVVRRSFSSAMDEVVAELPPGEALIAINLTETSLTNSAKADVWVNGEEIADQVSGSWANTVISEAPMIVRLDVGNGNIGEIFAIPLPD